MIWASGDILDVTPDVLPVDTSLEVSTDAVEPVDDGNVEALETITMRLDGLDAGLVALSDAVSQGSGSDEDTEVTASVVVLDSTQWEDVREAWGWCKTGFSVALYFVVLCTLLVAALLGTRLWATFAEGWRR